MVGNVHRWLEMSIDGWKCPAMVGNVIFKKHGLKCQKGGWICPLILIFFLHFDQYL